jgi:ATP-dependent helicase/nuclease subunit A
MSEPMLPFDDDDSRQAPVVSHQSADDSRLATDDLPPTDDSRLTTDDHRARLDAVDPSRNVVLEASAGTGKTRVLVERYVNLLRAGVDPDNILAITFTRKAAAEMRERIIDRLREASRLSTADLARWRDLKDRVGDIAISTIDAFCLSLLREFPLEADVDPGFDLADETDVPRLVDESLDHALRIARAIARDDDDVALVFAQLGERRLRGGLGALLGRRLVGARTLRRYLERGPRDLTAAVACERAANRLREVLTGVRGGLRLFLLDGPRRRPQFAMLAADITRLTDAASPAWSDLTGRHLQAGFRALIDRLRAYFMTQDGRPREKTFAGTGFNADDCDSPDAWKRHRQAAFEIAPLVADTIRAFRRDLNVVMSRGVWRVFRITLAQYQRTLDAHALLDFPGVLERALSLLRGMDEFAQSRFQLEARYRHVLVDEFQDTSGVQWALVSELVRSWGEGMGAADDAIAPSIFIVGDRKQSIYGFRDAEVGLIDEAASFIEALRGEGDPRRAITVSFRAEPALLAFVNDLFDSIEKAESRQDRFRYDDRDRFPIDANGAAPASDQGGPADQQSALGIVAGASVTASADLVAAEIVRLLETATVRDRATGVRRGARPADVAVLFRARDSHREFEKALERRGVSTYVYKGLGFFDADEIQDAVALLRYLADPLSNLRAAAFLRSRVVRLSDAAVAKLAPGIARALIDDAPPDAAAQFGRDDAAVFDEVRRAIQRWLSWVDRMTPLALLTTILAETAYSLEIQGSRERQAYENLKKLRGIVGRFQNRGYATLSRVADHLDKLAVGDESNASIDAVDSVSLMTVHAAKGLEFPIVFVVNLGRGTGGGRGPVRVGGDGAGEASVAIADYQSEADEDAAARDREETKRLLYVALTRARDRLYLSATVEEGSCRMGRGSLGEVLPSSVRELFVSAAAASQGAMIWTGPGGRAHRIGALNTTSVPPTVSPALQPLPASGR